MVASSTTTQQNGVPAAGATSASNVTAVSVHNNVAALPKGKYTLVGIDIDTTGRRLIDEIVQLAAFTPKDHFEQYIMPYMNLNPAARQRHQVRVISIGFYRMLKSMQTYKIIKSKSEIAALRDFLDWLEALKAKDASSQGVILLYHEERKFIPYMILESLKKYNLLDRFLNTVKSFANGLSLAKANANESLQHYSLRKLNKFLINNVVNNVEPNNNNVATTNTEGATVLEQTAQQQKTTNKTGASNERELFDGNASVRAKLAYEVALHLSNENSAESSLDSANALDKMLNALNPYAQPIQCDLNELQTQNQNLERQNSFRPVFLNYFKTALYYRVRAVKFRIILAEHGYDLQTLNAIWTEKKRDGLVGVLQVIEELKDEEKTELADLFESYYDPAKTTIKPVGRAINSRPRNRRARNNIRNDGNGGARSVSFVQQGSAGENKQDQSQQQNVNGAANLPDSTTKSPRRNKRNQRSQKSTNANNNNSSSINNNNTVIKTEPLVADLKTPTAVTNLPQTTNNATAQVSAPMAVAATN